MRTPCRHFKPQARTSNRSADNAVGGCAAACDGASCQRERGGEVRVAVRDWVVGLGRDQGRGPLIRGTREPWLKSRGRQTCRSEAVSIEPPAAARGGASCQRERGGEVRVAVRDWVVGLGRDQGRGPLIRGTREPWCKSRGRQTCRSEALSIEPPAASDDSASCAATEAAVPAASAPSPSCSPGGTRCSQSGPHSSLFLRQ